MSDNNGLRVYEAHGVDLAVPDASGEAIGECPFCGGSKFSVNSSTSKYKCWSGSCGVNGNSSTFMLALWELSLDQTKRLDYKKLANESGFSKWESVRDFGCVKSAVSGKWLIPGYNKDGKLTGLYRWTRIKGKDDKWQPKLLPTPGFSHHMFNIHNYEQHKPVVDLLEGWRDGIQWQEAISSVHSSSGVAMDTDRNVIAIPGTNVFRADWDSYFAGKVVNILFDNDLPRKNKKTGEMVDGAGIKGVKRIASILTASRKPPKEINFLDWTALGQDLPNGTDIRDYLQDKV